MQLQQRQPSFSAVIRRGRVLIAAIVCACAVGLAASAQPPGGAVGGVVRGVPPRVGDVRPVAETEAVAHDADDPAIWVHPTDIRRSLILGTDKIAVTGGLYVFGLTGHLRQKVGPLDRPNNVDVEYSVTLGAQQTDIAVVTERKQHRLRIYAIPANGGALLDLAPAGIPVLAGQTGEASEPMGVALYKRPRDGATFAIVAPKTGGTTKYLWQYRLGVDDRGGITGTLVRRFGNFSQRGAVAGEIGEIEAVVADDEMGYVYYSDERFGIRKWQADPDHEDAGRELAVFGTEGYEGDREGLAIYAPPGRAAATNSASTGGASTGGASAGGASASGGSTGGASAPGDVMGVPSTDAGFIVSSDQVAGATRVWLYPRAGMPGRPHQHPSVGKIVTPSDQTDGLDVTARSLPGFPRGLLVMMNSKRKNFLLYRWDEIESARTRKR